MYTIPAKYAEKMGVYDMIIHGASVKVRVIDNSEVVNLGISELQSEFKEDMIAGIMATKTKQYGCSSSMIVLCVKSRCLIIQVSRLQLIPQCLTDFLNSKEICFVGPYMSSTLSVLSSFKTYVRNGIDVSAADTHEMPFGNSRGMDVIVLAARVFQDPKLLRIEPMALTLQIIGDKAGVALDKNSSDCVDMTSIAADALVFSCDEIKHLVGDVYASYLIAVKLFDSL